MNCFSEIFFSTLSQQKLMRKKFLVKLKYLLILKIKKMKNLKSMTLDELKDFNGGELPYTEHAINGEGVYKSIKATLHNVGDFVRGFLDAF